MAFFQVLFLAVYFGTPAFIIYRWIRVALSSHKPVVWSMAIALGLWLLQATVLILAIFKCISGHCQVTPLEEYGTYGLMLCAYLGIGCVLWLTRRAR